MSVVCDSTGDRRQITSYHYYYSPERIV